MDVDVGVWMFGSLNFCFNLLSALHFLEIQRDAVRMLMFCCRVKRDVSVPVPGEFWSGRSWSVRSWSVWGRLGARNCSDVREKLLLAVGSVRRNG